MSIMGLILLILTYMFAPDVPQAIGTVVIIVMFILTIVSLLLGIVFSIIAIKNKESGVKKYFGILIPLFILLFVILIPILMGIGFMLYDKP